MIRTTVAIYSHSVNIKSTNHNEISTSFIKDKKKMLSIVHVNSLLFLKMKEKAKRMSWIILHYLFDRKIVKKKYI